MASGRRLGPLFAVLLPLLLLSLSRLPESTAAFAKRENYSELGESLDTIFEKFVTVAQVAADKSLEKFASDTKEQMDDSVDEAINKFIPAAGLFVVLPIFLIVALSCVLFVSLKCILDYRCNKRHEELKERLFLQQLLSRTDAGEQQLLSPAKEKQTTDGQYEFLS